MENRIMMKNTCVTHTNADKITKCKIFDENLALRSDDSQSLCQTKITSA